METYSSYSSPYSWRYGSPAMRHIWSEMHKRVIWRQIWVAVAHAQAMLGLVSEEQLNDLRAHVNQIDMERSLAIEATIKHDLVAELKTYAEQCPSGGAVLHLGLTSMDIVDNADVIRQRQALDLILVQLKGSLQCFAEFIEKHASTPVLGFTHLQPAEPTSLGYRFALTAQDLLIDYQALRNLRSTLKGKGIKGAVGTNAALGRLIGLENLASFEHELSNALDLSFYSIVSQTYPRRQDFLLVSSLASIGATVHKFAFDLRILQSPVFGELAEPFGEEQVGSSAMPFKRNPIKAEKIDSLARWLAQFPRTAWDNAANSLLERTLDDSANRRTTIPEAFLITEELLINLTSILSGLRVEYGNIQRNLENYAPFAALEPLLLELVRSGADRQKAHEHLRILSMQAWGSISKGDPNPLGELILHDEMIIGTMAEKKVKELMQVEKYLGDAPQRTIEMAQFIKQEIQTGQL